MTEELLSKTKANTEYMTFNGDEFTAKIVYIYDGDTMHVVFNALGDYYRWNCRVMGVDTPEIRTKNLKEKEMGYKVRDILKNYFLNQIVTIKCYKFDKYGRLLIDVFLPEHVPNDKNSAMLSNWLIDNEYAYPYGGGTKKQWDL